MAVHGGVLQKTYYRHKKCLTLISEGNACKSCIPPNRESSSSKQKVEPAKLNAPITLTIPDRIKLTLQNQRKRITKLEKQVDKLKSALEKSATSVSSNLHSDMKSIFEENISECSDFVRLFWSEQQKYIGKSKKGIRYIIL